MKELKIGCGKPTGSKVGEPGREKTTGIEAENKQEVAIMPIRLTQNGALGACPCACQIIHGLS